MGILSAYRSVGFERRGSGLNRVARWTLPLACLAIAVGSQAQITHGGKPLSYLQALPADIPRVELQEPVYWEPTNAEADTASLVRSHVYGFVVATSIDLRLLPSVAPENLGGRIWRVHLVCAPARSIAVNFNRFHLPSGARLFAFSPTDSTAFIGALTSDNNRSHGRMATSMIPGHEVILEYFEPDSAAFEGEVHITSVECGTSAFGSGREEKVFQDSWPCHINVACSSAYVGSSRSVVFITTATDSTVDAVSGVVVNNANEDGAPFVLSAWHNFVGEPDTALLYAKIYFRYRTADCAGNVDGPMNFSLVGATSLASYDTSGSDFNLLLLEDAIPLAYEPLYAGWETADTAPPRAYSIHHPHSDVKKISFANHQPQSWDWYYVRPPDTTHWMVTYFAKDSLTGTVEQGSSGSPLFDPAHRVIGTLTGSYTGRPNSSVTPCDSSQYNARACYGKFSVSWDQFSDSTQQLKYWLDPQSTGLTSIDSYDPLDSCCVNIRGDADYSFGAWNGISVADVTYLTRFLFYSGPAPVCHEEGNADGDPNEAITVSDISYLVAFLFQGGPQPPNCPY